MIGVGNAYRGDDGLGLAVTDDLRGRIPATVELVECEQEPSRLLDAWAGADAAIVVDAVEPGGSPGHVHRFDATTGPIPARAFRSSTHAFGVGEAIELARARKAAAGGDRVRNRGRRLQRRAGSERVGRARCRSRRSRRPLGHPLVATRGGHVHEHALMQDVMKKIEEVAAAGGAARVIGISVRLGALSHFTPSHFQDHFVAASRGTIAEGAVVEAVLDDDITDENAQDVVLVSVEVESPPAAVAT